MANWISCPLTLTGNAVDLVSLAEVHFDGLETLAKDKRIWQYYAYDGSDSATLRKTLEATLQDRDKGTQFPFVIVHNATGRLLGSTRFMDIQEKHRKLEIGSTWLHPECWGSTINLECKLLLLTYGFEILKASRVQLKTDENNTRSRKAIEKIGGKFEGILRNDMIRDNATKRNSAYYSIIEEEWAEKKLKLEARLSSSITLHEGRGKESQRNS